MAIIKTIKSWFKKPNIDDIEPMRQETHIPKYEPPVCYFTKNSPRIKYRRK